MKVRKAFVDDAYFIAEIKTKAYRDEKQRFKPEDFCVLPEYQGLGYGYRALNMMGGMFAHKKRSIWGTSFYSLKNQHLYEKVGYKRIGTASKKQLYYMRNL